MSTAAMCQYPDFFKVAVSCAGNHDNNIYNRWWSETHHGVKEVVSEKGDTTFVYKIATNPQIAKQLKGNLLLIHGDIDNNVHPGNTLRVVDALIRAGKRCAPGGTGFTLRLCIAFCRIRASWQKSRFAAVTSCRLAAMPRLM